MVFSTGHHNNAGSREVHQSAKPVFHDKQQIHDNLPAAPRRIYVYPGQLVIIASLMRIFVSNIQYTMYIIRQYN